MQSNSNSTIRNIVRHRILLLMLMPTTIYLIINNYVPLFGLLIAFKNVNYVDGIIKSPWYGFKNFEYLFSQNVWYVFRNTIAYNLAFIFLNLFLSVALAIALNELRKSFLTKLYQTTMILPNFLSMVVVSYLAYAFLNNEYGFINNSILKPLGMQPVTWYSESAYWPFIIVFINAWKSIGMNSIIYLAAIASIDTEYYEAAFIDGASKWQQIKSITIPMLWPVMVIVTVMSLGRILNTDFGLFYQVTLDSGALYSVTTTIDTYVYRALMQLHDIGMSSAAGFYQSVVGFIMVLGVNMIVRKISRENALF